MRHVLALTLLSALTVGCDGGGLACTDLAAVSATVNLTDADGGAAITDATVTYEVDGQAPVACEHFTDGTYQCGYEVEGDLLIRVVRDDYITVTETVTVAADECHVIGEVVDIALEPDECPSPEAPASLILEVSSSHEDGTDPLTGAEATYQLDGGAVADCEEGSGGTYVCGYETNGTFDWSVTAFGHSPATGSVVVERDALDCSVVTETVEVTLDCEAC